MTKSLWGDKEAPFSPAKYREFTIVRQRQRERKENEEAIEFHNAGVGLLYWESAKVTVPIRGLELSQSRSYGYANTISGSSKPYH